MCQQVFVSYAHDDRERVQPLVEHVHQRGWDVWWDTATRIGERWRDLMLDRLQHAQCVIAVWTPSSVTSSWVIHEATTAASRGVLVPLRLDDVAPPDPFVEFLYADLAGWTGGPHPQLDALLDNVDMLMRGALKVTPTTRIDHDRRESQRGVDEARAFVERVRTQTSMFDKQPEATAALGTALKGVAQTYDAVQDALTVFFAPLDAGEAITPERYRPLATGQLTADIESKRGHCTRIAQAYIAAGGLRDGLVATAEPAVVFALDDIFDHLSSADDDLFKAMVAVGDGLSNEASALVNLSLGGRMTAAKGRLEAAEQMLRPLVQGLNQGRAALNRLAGELGLVLDN